VLFDFGCWWPGAQLPHYAPGRSWSARDWFGLRWCGQHALGAQLADRLLEVLCGLEGAVDAREAQPGDLVERAKRAEDGQADLVGRDLRPALAAERILDGLQVLISAR